MPRSFGSWRRVWRLGPVLSRLLGDMTFTAIWLRLGGGRRGPASSLAGPSRCSGRMATRRDSFGQPISKIGRSQARAVKRDWQATAPGPCTPSSRPRRARLSDRRFGSGPQSHRTLLALVDHGARTISESVRRWSPTRRAQWNCRPVIRKGKSARESDGRPLDSFCASALKICCRYGRKPAAQGRTKERPLK